MGLRPAWPLVALLAVPSAKAQESRLRELPVQETFHGLSFSPGRPCGQRLFPEELCRTMRPKRWLPNEIAAVRGLLAPLFEPGTGLPGFIGRVRANGFGPILRYSSGSGSAWVSHKDHSIDVADSLLDREYPPDTSSGFDLRKQILLHELAHAFDIRELVYSEEFLGLAGWREENGAYVLPGVDGAELRATVARFIRLIGEGKMLEAYRLNRDYGLAHGFPTAYAMTSPSECFAELASHIFYDPTAERYLNAELVRWFRRRVLN